MDNKDIGGASSPGQRRKRGRRPKVKDNWSVIDGGFAGTKRPDAPEELTAAQAAIWRKIVASEPPDFFSSQTTRDMLKDLVCHRDAIDQLAKTINAFRTEWLRNDEGSKMYNRYLRMRGDETRHFSLIATRLRLTNQSRYTPRAAATAERNAAKVRPWEEAD